MPADLAGLISSFAETSDDPAQAAVLAYSFVQQARRWTEAGLAVCPSSAKLKARLAVLATLLAPPIAERPN